ncbi:MAG: methionine--tRNA ligase [Candidatus Dormibacteraeota bacterium]|nr:methionine--tRNA ligase [Candidatus Dormibacteraeota bacterium]
MPRVLITSALPYINGIKHLGNLVGSMLPADVHARYLRQRGHDVLFICATDEHGTPAELAAAEAGLPVAEYCAQQHEVQAQLAQQFGLSFDHFGRSSSPQNAEFTRHMAERLRDNGLIEERVSDQVYSLDDERFLPDRYIIGTCPVCGYERARGDQCENCTSLLEPTRLINPRSAISGSTRLEVRPTRHLYIRQSVMADRIREFIDSHGDWPVLVTSIARNWLNVGLEDRSITRDLSWGVPVGWPGLENKVFYVWFDAPIEYIGATKEWADLDPEHRDWRSWWYETKDVRYVQFMGKDNVPFHAINFPATIIGTGEPWKLVDYIKAFNWLTYYGGKYSTSEHRGVFMNDAVDVLPADYWRYALLAAAPESDDADFTWESFALTVNKDLAGILGNFVTRTLKLTQSRFGAVVPEGGEPGDEERALYLGVDEALQSFVSEMEALRFRPAAFALRTLWTQGNMYLDRTAPWSETDVARVACILRTAINLARLHAVVSHSFIPFAAERLAADLGLRDDERAWPGSAADELQRLEPGREFRVGEPLFPRIGDRSSLGVWIGQMEERFGGPASKARAG